MSTHLVWFRNDLRINDNTALYTACLTPNIYVLAVFIATPKQWLKHSMAPCQAKFIYDNLIKLQKELAKKSIPLYYYQCNDFFDSINWLISFCMKKKITALFYNLQYELNEWNRDQILERRLSGKVHCYGFNDSLLFPPKSITNTTGNMYKVYTPFRNVFIRRLMNSNIDCFPEPRVRGNMLSILNIPPMFKYPSSLIDNMFPAGEKEALQRLKNFCFTKEKKYFSQRNFPAIDSTSKLSPYLAIGVLSPRQCFNQLCIAYPLMLKKDNHNTFYWLNQLIWREFYRNLIIVYPELCKHQPFIKWTNIISWNNNTKMLHAWKVGKTGYPIVDAAMRQLIHTGWINNRLRMISASFLVKDLLIDWRIGERYFMSKLLDGDLAANNGGWQWIASTGTDSVPYFRIFNPTTQSKFFDPLGIFIRKWLPELEHLSNDEIHEPYKKKINKKILLKYPLPIVNHQKSRLKILSVFQTAKLEFNSNKK
ncbi:Deoxyribodipyrimidine photo-lyase [Candidatus Ecksteinia adelgidicola]|nr:Deoxyribodipyrimidine photo-lyase [Candidatus Ecksteinia adelgidicola]